VVTKIVNGVKVKIRTDEEILDFVCDEFKRAKTDYVRRRAKLIFDKRFPNDYRAMPKH
jgi:hypothetical protein